MQTQRISYVLPENIGPKIASICPSKTMFLGFFCCPSELISLQTFEIITQKSTQKK